MKKRVKLWKRISPRFKNTKPFSPQLYSPREKVQNYIWIFKIGDPDDKPSVPHGHAKDVGYRLDVWTGNIYPAGKERKNSIKILQCIVMFVMAVISFWIYVSVLTGKFNHYMMLVFLVEIIDVFMVTLVIKIFRNLIDIYFEWKENKRCEGMD